MDRVCSVCSDVVVLGAEYLHSGISGSFRLYPVSREIAFHRVLPVLRLVLEACSGPPIRTSGIHQIGDLGAALGIFFPT
jgi:hypothetical protein